MSKKTIISDEIDNNLQARRKHALTASLSFFRSAGVDSAKLPCDRRPSDNTKTSEKF